MKVFYFDTETTGFDSVKHDIIQIAGIVEVNGKEMSEFNFKCQPFNYAAVEEQALEVNKITMEALRTFPEPRIIYNQLIGVLNKYVDRYDKADKFTIAGQNASFDAGFLKEFFIKNGDSYFGSWFNYQHVDLVAFSRVLQYAGLLDTENVRLATLAEKFGVELKAHDALEDIRATRELLGIMTRKYLVSPKVDGLGSGEPEGGMS